MGTTAPAENSQVSAVAAADPETAESKTQLAIGNLPDPVKHALILKRQQNLVTAQIAETNWGKGLDIQTRRAIGDWSQRVGIDPATELDVLGGRFYKNAQYYLRRLSEFVERGIVTYAYADHVEADVRLAAMAARTDNPEFAGDAQKEADRRMKMRVDYAIPENAKSAVVFHVKLTLVPYEFSAAKWCGTGRKTRDGSKAADPIGDEFPVETSETRAIRRTMRLIATHNPTLGKLVEPNDDEDTIDTEIGETLRAGMLRAHDDIRQAVLQGVTSPLVATDEPYGKALPPAPFAGTRTIEVEGVKVPIPVAAVVDAKPAERSAAIRPTSDMASPFDEPDTRPGASLEAIDDTDLLSPEERREHEQRKAAGR